MQIEKQEFGKSTEGRIVDPFTLINDKGMTAKISNFGGTLVSLMVPDKTGKLADVVLGFDNFEDYLKDDNPSSTLDISQVNK